MPSKERSKLKEKQLVEEVDVGAVPAGDPPRASKKAKPASKNKAAAQEIEEESTGLVAVVVGATGAVGRFLVQSLLVAKEWKRVIVIGRRTGVGKFYTDSPKLVEIVGALDGMCAETHPAYQAVAHYQPHAAYCCLGTTYDDAGKSKKKFKLVDYTYVTDFAWMTRHLHVPSFNLVSSMGTWAHSPFLYPRTKGKAEKFIKSLVFPILLIYRPGLLGRPEPRSDETCYGHVASALSTEFFGKLMERAALDLLDTTPGAKSENRELLFGGGPLFQKTWDNDKIYSYAKKHHIPKTVKATDVL